MLPGACFPSWQSWIDEKKSAFQPPIPLGTRVTPTNPDPGGTRVHIHIADSVQVPHKAISMKRALLPFHTQVLRSSLIVSTTHPSYIILIPALKELTPIITYGGHKKLQTTDDSTARAQSTPNEVPGQHSFFLMALSLPMNPLACSWDYACCSKTAHRALYPTNNIVQTSGLWNGPCQGHTILPLSCLTTLCSLGAHLGVIRFQSDPSICQWHSNKPI